MSKLITLEEAKELFAKVGENKFSVYIAKKYGFQLYNLKHMTYFGLIEMNNTIGYTARECQFIKNPNAIMI